MLWVHGWEKCIFSFSNLQLDAWNGVLEIYQKIVKGTHSTLSIMHERKFIIQEMLKEALMLMRQVRDLLPLFKKAYKHS